MTNLLRLLGAFCVACLLACLLVGRRLAAALGALLFIVLLPGLAAAADTATSIDFSPFIAQYVLPLVFGILGLLGSWVLLQLRTKLGLTNDAWLSSRLEDAMRNGLALAQSQLQLKVAQGPIALDLKNQAVAIAAQYTLDHVPDTLKALGVDQGQLMQKVEARLAVNTTPAEQSIAVPTPAPAAK